MPSTTSLTCGASRPQMVVMAQALMSLDLLPPTSWGLVLLLDLEPSPWPCLDTAASAQFFSISSLSPSESPRPFFLFSLSVSLAISVSALLSPSLLAVYTGSGSALSLCLLERSDPYHCLRWLTQCGIFPSDLFLIMCKVPWDNIVINWHFE